MKIYLDNCCYNRPYDDQSQLKISLETQAKLYIQDGIKDGVYELVTSFILRYENSANPYNIRKSSIESFIDLYSSIYVSSDDIDRIKELSKDIINTGVKAKDALHVACAIYSECDYFISTDRRLLKYKSDRVRIVDPLEFIRLEVNIDE